MATELVLSYVFPHGSEEGMRRVAVLLAALAGSSCTQAPAGDNRVVATVAGPFRGACEREGESGSYRYSLAGQEIRSLASECAPDHSAHYVNFKEVWRAKNSTTVLALEGMSGVYQHARLLHFRARQLPLAVHAFGGDVISAKQRSVDRFHFVMEGRGFALSSDRQSHWICVYDVDFKAATVSYRLQTPHEAGLDASLCDAQVEQVRL